jgi:hypothetical protein
MKRIVVPFLSVLLIAIAGHQVSKDSSKDFNDYFCLAIGSSGLVLLSVMFDRTLVNGDDNG